MELDFGWVRISYKAEIYLAQTFSLRAKSAGRIDNKYRACSLPLVSLKAILHLDENAGSCERKQCAKVELCAYEPI